MQNHKILLRFISIVVVLAMAIAIPFAVLYLYAKSRPKVYTESYNAALQIKYDRLTSIREPKILVIGGSSVAFGIDSKIVEKELSMPCVNMGLYAAFGLKPMLDLSIKSIRKNDIVVIAPELSSQMYSDYVGYDFLLQAMEGRIDMAKTLGLSYAKGFIHELPSYVKAAKKLKKKGTITASGVYAKSSFDSYGDITYTRDKNIMESLYSEDNLPEIDSEIITDSFVDMINAFVKKAEKKGAKVYFTFPPINKLSVDGISDNDRVSFVKELKNRLNCQVIGSLNEHIMDEGYFYDSNFHANDAGMIVNTVLLVNDIKRVTNKLSVTGTKIPKPIATNGAGQIISSGTYEGYEYDVTENGAYIKGIDDTIKNSSELMIPDSIEGYKVVKIQKAAFDGSLANTIILPETISSINAGAFSGASELTKVVLLSKKLPEVGNGLLDGASSSVLIYVPKDLYGNYVTDYFWGQYEPYIREN